MKEMKHVIFFVIFFVGLTVFSFAEERVKSIKVTDVDSRYYSVYSFHLSNDEEEGYAADIYVGCGNHFGGNTSLQNRVLMGDLYNMIYNSARRSQHWTGSGSYYLVIMLRGEFEGQHFIFTFISRNKISFENTVTELSFNDFRLINRSSGQ